MRFYARSVQCSVTVAAGWTSGLARSQHIVVSLIDLTDLELATAAQACRAMAHQEGERARTLENPTTRGTIEATAKRYAVLAARLEAARKMPAS